MELEETVPDGPVVGDEASAQPWPGDKHMNGSPFLSRLNRPRSVSSGRQSNQIPEFDSRPVRPRNFSNSGRQSELDNSRHDRSLVKDSTGRQCLDLHEKDSFDTNDAGLVKNLTSDNYNVHIVNVGNTAIDTPHKENASFFSNNANVSTRESRPRTLICDKKTTKDGMSSEGQWSTACSRTLILSGERSSTPYFREDFLDGLKLVLGDEISHIVSFGPLAKNTEWFLMVKSEKARDQLLVAGIVKVKGGVFRVRSADSTQFRVRVHWAPPFIPNEVIIYHLSQFGKVLSCVNELSVSKGFENIATGVRTIVMCGNKADLPHFFVVVDKSTKQTFQLLVTVTGRPPICLRCNIY